MLTRHLYLTNSPTCKASKTKGAWVQGDYSGLDKRQCTVQLTLFADMQFLTSLEEQRIKFQDDLTRRC